MTALEQYRRLEATGLWRDGVDEQRREVVVALGDATLVISNLSDSALSHWSIAAIRRLNPGRHPALYAPGREAEERLELDDADMIAAIEKLRLAIERRRPHPGRLRHWIGAAVALAVLALAVLWLPGALTRHTAALLPEASRAEIGRQLLAELTRLAGPVCRSPQGQTALNRLVARSFPEGPAPQAVILSDTLPETLSLPGNILVGNAALVEDYETPDVLAGYLLAEDARRAELDPLQALLESAGLAATFRLLTTGKMATPPLHAHAAQLLSRPRAAVADAPVLARFEAARISSEPYAYSRDVTGESVLGLIEANPVRGQRPPPVLSDAAWLSLQEICTR